MSSPAERYARFRADQHKPALAEFRDLYDFELDYQSRPNWHTYRQLLELARLVCAEQRDLGPRDLIDAQSFLWVQGSQEYEE